MRNKFEKAVEKAWRAYEQGIAQAHETRLKDEAAFDEAIRLAIEARINAIDQASRAYHKS